MSIAPPVILIGFRRPDLMRVMLDNIAQAKPVRFYVSIDGPREGRDDDAKAVNEIKELIAQYEPILHPIKRYSEKNLGCAKNMSGSISWFFEHEEAGIILEDDCLPDPSFYRFCAELLDYYKDDPHVMQIAGYNRYPQAATCYGDSYFFSYHGWQWGWATWRRAWRRFDLHLTKWEEYKRRGLHKSDPFSKNRINYMNELSSGKNDQTWAMPWSGCMAMHHGLSVVPYYPMVKNIGAGYHGSHGAQQETARDLGEDIHPAQFPLCHPDFVVDNMPYDSKIRELCRPTKYRICRRFVGDILRAIGLRKRGRK